MQPGDKKQDPETKKLIDDDLSAYENDGMDATIMDVDMGQFRDKPSSSSPSKSDNKNAKNTPPAAENKKGLLGGIKNLFKK